MKGKKGLEEIVNLRDLNLFGNYFIYFVFKFVRFWMIEIRNGRDGGCIFWFSDFICWCLNYKKLYIGIGDMDRGVSVYEERFG